MAGKGRQAQPGQEGSRPGRLQGTATGAGMGEKQIKALLEAIAEDIDAAKEAGQWAAVNANRRIERQLHIDLAEAVRIRKAEAAARKAERIVTLEEARAMLVKALRGLPEADREAVIEEATGPARLALVEGE